MSPRQYTFKIVAVQPHCTISAYGVSRVCFLHNVRTSEGRKPSVALTPLAREFEATATQWISLVCAFRLFEVQVPLPHFHPSMRISWYRVFFTLTLCSSQTSSAHAHALLQPSLECSRCSLKHVVLRVAPKDTAKLTKSGTRKGAVKGSEKATRSFVRTRPVHAYIEKRGYEI